ncbi:hypothetical protein GCM10023349_01480 [Nocardioides conyzicola]|uniref:DUF3515 domain-containing protein n=1 Tax=Nocardioides conyzicola TaxID=1651781 RepID=A0ABP8WJ64_9ACTN
MLLAGCSTGQSVELAGPPPSAEDAQACRDLVADLPDTLAGLQRREVTGDTAYAAAWGDPAIVLVCGAADPAGRTDASTCVQVGRTGWYVPDSVLATTVDGDQTADVPTTELNFSPRVALLIPGRYRPEGFSDSIATIGPLVQRHFTKVGRCL